MGHEERVRAARQAAEQSIRAADPAARPTKDQILVARRAMGELRAHCERTLAAEHELGKQHLARLETLEQLFRRLFAFVDDLLAKAEALAAPPN